jgi:hypothetical protein
MTNYNIVKPTIKNLLVEIEKELEELLGTPHASKIEDLEWSIYRLEDAPKGSKLICVHEKIVPAKLKVEEGYWTINDKAYYLAVPRI